MNIYTIYIYIVQMCRVYNKFIYPRWSRVEVVLQPTGSQAPPITSIGRPKAQAKVIQHDRRLEAWRTFVNICIYTYIYVYRCVMSMTSSIPDGFEWRWSSGPRARRHLRSRPLGGSRPKQN